MSGSCFKKLEFLKGPLFLVPLALSANISSSEQVICRKMWVQVIGWCCRTRWHSCFWNILLIVCENMPFSFSLLCNEEPYWWGVKKWFLLMSYLRAMCSSGPHHWRLAWRPGPWGWASLEDPTSLGIGRWMIVLSFYSSKPNGYFLDFTIYLSFIFCFQK